jgi:SAM-dependent methyltransferase
MIRARRSCWQLIKRYYPVQEQKAEEFGRLLDRYLEAALGARRSALGECGGMPPGRTVSPCLDRAERGAPSTERPILLDIGCGRGLETARVYRERAVFSVGVDLAEAVRENQTVAHRVRGEAMALPFGTESVDIAVCQELIEHLASPEAFFREVARVLRPGGVFLLMTPNLLAWPTLVSRALPYALHQRLNRQLFGIDDRDVFPTYYRANTVPALDRALGLAGLSRVDLRMYQPSPGLLTFSLPLTWLEIVGTRLARRWSLLTPLRYVILAAYEKAVPGAQCPVPGGDRDWRLCRAGHRAPGTEHRERSEPCALP